jgi:serine O-acetyltransferase
MSDLINNSLQQLTEMILASYDMEEKTRRIGERFLPSRSRIVEIISELRRMLFPGYFGHKKLTNENVRFHVGNLLARLSSELTEEITHCICTERTCKVCDEPDPCYHEAEHKARDFLARIPQIRQMLAMDAQAAYDGDPAAKSIDEVIYCYPGFYAVTIYRIAHGLLELGVALMPRIMTEYAHSVTGADIHPGAKIGKSFFIDHATGVVIGETCQIGDNVKIYQGVTLGALSFPKDERGRVIRGLQRHPTIEDNATIYAAATILGGETVIGKGVTVGGNTFVTKSIMADSTVLNRPAKLHVRAKRSKADDQREKPNGKTS